ncbi:hypothetical protein L3Q82_014610 [Scortum barcoo]|uniref:Uncharacterized protein n=1 Tax=Scortum barcoo TaxID=214431 RepID=A0ACB8VXK4_9TELE|nr:hypothetical protein L3Q82_014610 [Scortum barcoo]
MKGTAVALVVLSGLCFLPACSPRLYILVQEAKTWAAAQSYCRESITDSSAALIFSGTAGQEMTSSSFIFVKELKTWSAAQNYCRTQYTDLVSVRNNTENDQVKMLAQNNDIWIGLHRDSWKWSDGSSHSFSNWAANAPSTTLTDSCTVSNFGKWVNNNCNSQLQSVCYSAPMIRKQVVKVMLKTTDSRVDMENLKEGILNKFNQRLEDAVLSEDVKIRWVEQPDGKVFHKKNTNKGEEKGEKKCMQP